VGSALHDDHILPGETPEDEATGMAFDRARREVGNFVVRQRFGGGNLFGESAQARAQDDPHPRFQRHPFGDGAAGFFHFFPDLVHEKAPLGKYSAWQESYHKLPGMWRGKSISILPSLHF
jgi:hypothetical protein